ncbi:hypothetical protein ABPG72_022367 [Tetrahymena utriculariae]
MSFRQFVSLGKNIFRSGEFKKKAVLGAGVCLTAGGFIYQSILANEYPETTVYSWGYGGFGQLGLQNENNYYNPTEIEVLSDKKIKKVEAGKSISMALTHNGEVYSWGKNKGGILGHEDRLSFNMTQPERIEKLLGQKVKQISCGQFHMAAVTEDGDVYTWGNKEFGKLGHEDEQKQEQKIKIKRGNLSHDYLQDSMLPQKIESLGNIKAKQVACGVQFTVVLSEDGKVYTFGYNQYGSLGYVSDQNSVSTPQLVKGLNDIVKISAGYSFCAAITKQGKLYTWGNNRNGQLGNSQNLYQTQPSIVTGFGSQNSIVDVSCGDNFIAALTQLGQLYTWGFGGDGQLGHGNKSDLYAPRHIEFKQKIIKVACGGSHTAFITEDNQLYQFGRGSEGQLGIGQNVTSEASFRSTPNLVQNLKGKQVIDVTCGGEHTIAITQEFQKPIKK